jgi:hypothetical protein
MSSVSASEVRSRFDWSLPSAYDYTAQLTPRDWAWEFLRRNPEFQMAWWQSRDAFEITFSGSTLTIIHAHESASALERWGCLYTDAPDIDARTANIFWLPSYTPTILPMHALPASAPMPAAPLALRDLSRPLTVLHTPDDVQHVLLHGSGHNIQLAISGASILEPVHLLAKFEFGSEDMCRQVEVLHQFNNLIAGVLSAGNQEATRLRNVLQALDGSLAGASHRDIAIALFGAARVEADWNDPRQNMRDRVRRAVHRGRALMTGGYKKFLR